MAWVTTIGPNDEQTEYRLTGRHGCSQAEAVLVRAAPLLEAIRTRATQLTVAPETLFSSAVQRGRFEHYAYQLQHRGNRYRIPAGAALGLANAAGLSAHDIYGEDFTRALGAQQDPELAYRMDLNERPLMWIGEGLRAFGITPGSELPPDQFDVARALMKGYDPLTGDRLIKPKVAVDPRAKLPGQPLLAAIHMRAAEQGRPPEQLFTSKNQRDAYKRLVNQVRKRGESHKVKFTDVGKLADAAGVDVIALYGKRAVNRALKHERDRIIVGNRGYDLTLTLPKPFSILFAFAQDELAAEVEEVFVTALKEAVRFAERHTAYGMRGHHSGEKSAQRVSSAGLLGWVNIHRMARPVGDAPFGDPHIHGHVTLANMCRGQDGTWSTIAAGGRDLHRHARAIDAVMQARIRKLTSERWGIEWQRNKHTGVWEIIGIPEETVRLFSKRSGEVRHLFEALGIPYVETTTDQQKAAAAKTANSKREESTSASDQVLHDFWREEARASGQDPDQILDHTLSPTDPIREYFADQAISGPRFADDLAGIAAWVFRADDGGLTSHRKDFSRAEALAAVADAVGDGVSSAEEAEQLTDQVLSYGGIAVKLHDKGPRHLSNRDRYTTTDVVAAEREIIRQARARFGDGSAIVSEASFHGAIEVYQLGQRAENPDFALSPEQLDVLCRLLREGHGIDALIGVAGSGKTTIMEVARIAWESEGKVVMGASTAAVAAANLRMEAGIPSMTIARLLRRLPAEPGQPSFLDGVDVLVLDEAAMLDDRQLAEVLKHLAATGTKVVGIGDPKQLQSPGVGGSFAAVHQLVRGAVLSENYRQRDAIERAALRLWRQDQKREALRLWADHGRVHAASTRARAMAGMLVAWDARRGAYSNIHDSIANVLMLASRNRDVDELNTAARAIRRLCREIGEHEEVFALAGGGTVAFSIGDVVLLRRNDYSSRWNQRQSDVLNGYRGVIVEIDEQRRVLVEWRGKDRDGRRSLFREWVDAAYIAKGGLSHGIAMTVHKAQGLSVDHALVYGPGLAANGAYTALSRDKLEVHLFLPRDEFEDAALRAALGDPRTSSEELDRVLAAFADTLEWGSEEPLIITELGETIEPVAPAPLQEVGAQPRWRPGGLSGPNASWRGPDYRDIARLLLADLVPGDISRVLNDRAWPALAAVLRRAEGDGHDPVALLATAATEGSLPDVDAVVAVLTWRIQERLVLGSEVARGKPDREAGVGSRLHPAGRSAAESESAQRAASDSGTGDAEHLLAWRDRPLGDLGDEELAAELAEAKLGADEALAEMTALAQHGDQLMASVREGNGPAAHSVQGRYADLQSRITAMAELKDLDDAYGAAFEELTALRSAVSTAQPRTGRRRPRTEDLGELRARVADAERLIIELDIRREVLERRAGPVHTREVVRTEFAELDEVWPRHLALAQRMDLEDAVTAHQQYLQARERVQVAQELVEVLQEEHDLRERLSERQRRDEQRRRVPARFAHQDRGPRVPAGEAQPSGYGPEDPGDPLGDGYRSGA
ncbi:hypothetical protein GCM10010411_76290 [Actinomadura fulvescens]|uniref:AAA+ ATPase domain-containing protein n=1 Tax=Actinomadura fulvescens TaxID=46160 RepID=A0ABP6CYM7_9ACTN